jgi:hypothetical protein
VIARWKGIIEEIHFGGSIMPFLSLRSSIPKKPSFRPSKWPQKLKLLKIVNCQNCQKTVLSQLEKVGGHRISIWINEAIQQLQQRITNRELQTLPSTLEDVRDQREETAQRAVERINILTMECKKLSDRSAQTYE